jgi:N-acetylneuraminic acid mutarotase
MVKHTLKAGCCTSAFGTILFYLFVSLSLVSNSMASVWVGGSKSEGKFGAYGIQGVYDSMNNPGARYHSTIWAEPNGIVWVFGGEGIASVPGADGHLNDLWKYSPVLNQWAWVDGNDLIDQPGVYGTLGAYDAANIPGGRVGSAYWMDSNNIFWLFGGVGYDMNGNLGILNDLWRYSPVLNQWAWMGGMAIKDQIGIYGDKSVYDAFNIPGARALAACWVDPNDDVWLFGGQGYSASDSGYLNDLWKYSSALHQWAWMGGTQLENQAGSYGSLEVFRSTNVPGSRWGSFEWIDSDENLFIFGGFGSDENANLGHLNDLWKYSTTLNQWALMGGTKQKDQSGIYGFRGIYDTANIPGGRYSGQAWVDSDEDVFIFGGQGYDEDDGDPNLGLLNDIWKYDPDINQWAWISGAKLVNQVGVYGIKGAYSPEYYPGSRAGSAGWIDSYENVWLFGGTGLGEATGGYLNDMWRFHRGCIPSVGDLDGNCSIDLIDFAMMALHWLDEGQWVYR